MSNKQTTAAPAEQASKQVPTIDTPEFRELMAEHWKACGSVKANKAFAVVVAHIDAQLAGQPAAPVAATEQAIPQGWKLVPAKPTAEMLKAGAESEDRHFGLIIHNCYCAMVDAAPTAPLATPADAGVGLMDCDAAFNNWYAAQSHQLTNEQVCRLIWQRGWQACARISTSAAPVTAALTHVDTELATDVNAELLKRLEWAVRFIETYAHKAAMPATPEVNKCRAAIAKAKGGAA